MVSSPINTYLVQRDAKLDFHLYVPEPAAAIISPADVEKAGKLNHGEMDVVELFLKPEIQGPHMRWNRVRNILTRTVSLLDTGAETNVVLTAFFPV